jgi:hypothetical protein
MKNAAPKLSDERCRQILAFACEARDKDTLFVNLLASELEALAQEALDKRTALLVLNARLDEVEAIAAADDARFKNELARAERRNANLVSKSSIENDRGDVEKIDVAPGPSRK